MGEFTLGPKAAPADRPDIARAFAHLARGAAGSPLQDPIAALRAHVDTYGDLEPRGPLVGVQVRPVGAGGVPAEWLIPDGLEDGLHHRIVYLHGGGWVAGGLESHRPMAAEIARQAGCPLLLVDYRLAPENPFPAAFDDCVRVLAWADRHGPCGESEAERLMLAGDSAGANLAAAITLQALSNGGRVPDHIALLSPPLDARANPARGPAADASGDHAALAAVMALYAQGEVDLEDTRISPLHAPDDLLARFPATLIQVSSAEFLLWDAQEFARRLTVCGVRVTLSVWPHLPHVWQALLTLLPDAKDALAEVAHFLGDRPASRATGSL